MSTTLQSVSFTVSSQKTENSVLSTVITIPIYSDESARSYNIDNIRVGASESDKEIFSNTGSMKVCTHFLFSASHPMIITMKRYNYETPLYSTGSITYTEDGYRITGSGTTFVDTDHEDKVVVFPTGEGLTREINVTETFVDATKIDLRYPITVDTAATGKTYAILSDTLYEDGNSSDTQVVLADKLLLSGTAIANITITNPEAYVGTFSAFIVGV